MLSGQAGFAVGFSQRIAQQHEIRPQENSIQNKSPFSDEMELILEKGILG